MERTVEAYLGEYASGKSENAVARALEIASRGEKVTLVDLDLVEPCYTLRPLIGFLSRYGVDVLAWEPGQTFGLGEAGQVLLPAARWALRRKGHIIFDVGYGAGGAGALNLIEDIENEVNLRYILVVNFSRPLVGSKEAMLKYINTIGRADGLIANTHLGVETSPQTVLEGLYLTEAVSEAAGAPIDAVAVSGVFNEKYPDFAQKTTYTVRVLRDILTQGFW
jgi:hypothetical protein